MTERWTDRERQTEESDFIGHIPTNVERPTSTMIPNGIKEETRRLFNEKNFFTSIYFVNMDRRQCTSYV